MQAHRLATMLMALALLPGAAAAQVRGGAHGGLAGQVLWPDGKPAAGARIIRQASYGSNPHAARADAQGRFRFASLRPGLYELRAQAKGHWSEWEHNVLVRPGQETHVTLHLVLKQPSRKLPSVLLPKAPSATAQSGRR